MTDELIKWQNVARETTRERDEARFDLEKWDDLRAETHEQMRAGLTEMIQSKWDAEACDPDAAMAADTVLDYLENDFAGQLARMQQRAEKAEAAVTRVRQVHRTVLDLDGKRMCAAECESVPCPTIRALDAAPSCRWPACLTEADQQQLCDDIGKEMLGETTEPGPDPQAACGCDGSEPELTREELQNLVDEQGRDLLVHHWAGRTVGQREGGYLAGLIEDLAAEWRKLIAAPELPPSGGENDGQSRPRDGRIQP